jgi:hypothetical protein
VVHPAFLKEQSLRPSIFSQRASLLAATCFVCAATLAPVSWVQAAIITVDSLADPGTNGDSDTTAGDGVAGSGADTIDLTGRSVTRDKDLANAVR